MKRGMLCVAALAVASLSAVGETVAVWDGDVSVEGGLGWRDNVLRSGVMNEDSAFMHSVVDASAMRLSETDAFLMFYLLADDIRYFDAPSVNYEQFLSLTAQGSIPVGVRDELGLMLNYLYQHQIVDASATEADLRRVLVLGHSLSARPYWKRLFPKSWAFKLEGVAVGQVFEHELDSYWEGGGAAALSKGYGNRSEVALLWESLVRHYDTREQLDLDGFAVPDTRLEYFQNEVGAEWRHNWDAARTWRTLSRLGYLLSVDNGSGYFDYDRLVFRQRVQWRPDKWTFELNARLSAYRHPNQNVIDEERWRAAAVLEGRVERSLAKHLDAFAAAESEWSRSNDARDEYDAWMASLGLALMF